MWIFHPCHGWGGRLGGYRHVLTPLQPPQRILPASCHMSHKLKDILMITMIQSDLVCLLSYQLSWHYHLAKVGTHLSCSTQPHIFPWQALNISEERVGQDSRRDFGVWLQRWWWLQQATAAYVTGMTYATEWLAACLFPSGLLQSGLKREKILDRSPQAPAH